MSLIVCNVCGIPQSDDQFYRRVGGRIRPVCKGCWAKGRKVRYIKNRERICTENRARYRDDPDFRKRCLEEGARWKAENRGQRLSRAREYERRRNREHPEEAQVRRKRWLARHPEYRREYQRRPEVRLYKRLWQHKRRALLGGKVNVGSYRFVVQRDHSACQYCSLELKPREITIDHILPVSRGGTNDIENLCVSCLPCNLRKFTKLIAPLGEQTKTSIIVRPRMQMFDVAGMKWIVVPRKFVKAIL